MGQYRCSDSQIKVREYLRSLEIKIGERLPGEREMAVRLGLGRTALRSVLDDLEAEGVLLRQAQSGSYLVSLPAPAVHNTRVFVIGPFQGRCGPEKAEESSWLYRVVSALERTAGPAGLQLVLKDQSPYVCDPCSIKALVHEAVDGGAQAAVLLNPVGPHEKIVCALGMLHDRNIHPIVVSSKNYPGLASQIYFDSGWGIYLATRHLLAAGHRRVAFAAGPGDLDWVAERLTGYRNALEAMSLEPRPEYEWLSDSCEPLRPDECGYDILRRWSSLPTSIPPMLGTGVPRPTAIVAGNDAIALAILRAAQATGIVIPHDLSLVGFDNQPAALLAGLTTVERPTEALGEAVARVTLELLAAGPEAPAVTMRLRPVLIPRSTVGGIDPGPDAERQ
jgi:DNA-binding LacI/PurR family transcriptional regulator